MSMPPRPALTPSRPIGRRPRPIPGMLVALSAATVAAAQPATPPPAEEGGGGAVNVPAGVSFSVTVEGGGIVLGGGDQEPISIQLSMGDWLMPVVNAPGLLEVAALLRPEFIRRDLELLVRELSLDEDQAVIAESLLEDYAAAFTLAAEPFNDAFRRFRRQESDRTIARVLEDQGGGGEGVPDGAQVFMIGGDGGAGPFSGGAVVAIGIAVATTEDEAVGGGAGEPEPAVEPETPRPRRTLLDRVKQRLADAERAGEVVTAEGLLRLAVGLRAEREILRTEFIELLGLVAEAEPTDSGADRLAEVLRAIAVERERPHGRLAGESMHLEAVLARTQPITAEAADAAGGLLAERDAALAAALTVRAAATLDRELAGLAARVERDRLADADAAEVVDEAADDRPSPALRRFVAAAERELDARLEVRSLQMSTMDLLATAIATTDPDAAERFTDIARGEGFPADMRRLWAERAIEAASGLEGLDPEVLEVIAATREQTRREVRELQDRRIAWRLEQEPAFFRRTLAVLRGDAVDAEVPWDMPEDLSQRQVRIDESVDAQLAAILRPEQSASLPPRGRRGQAAGSVLTISPGRPTDS